MPSKQVVVSQAVLPAGVGPVTEKRLNLVMNALGKPTAVVTRAQDMPGMAFVLLPETGLQLQVSPDVLGVGFLGKPDSSLVSVLPQVDRVLQNLAAEVTGPVTVRMVAHVELSQRGDDVLKALAGSDLFGLTRDLHQLAWGVGFRYFLESPQGRGEYKVEPLVTDRRLVYVEYIMSAASVLTSQALEAFVQHCEESFRRLTDELAAHLDEIPPASREA